VNGITRHSKHEIALARLKRNFPGETAVPAGVEKMRASSGAWFERVKTSIRRWRKQPISCYEYEDAVALMLTELDKFYGLDTVYPSILPDWDNSARSGVRALILKNSTPELFRQHVRDALLRAENLQGDNRIVFVKSWNEWAEGNYLEPDQRFGHQYLEVLREEVLLRNEDAPTLHPLSSRSKKSDGKRAQLTDAR
jgi:hypothetical protein